MSNFKWTEDKTWKQMQEEIREYYTQQSREFEEKQKRIAQEKSEQIAKERANASKENPIIGSALRKYEIEARAHGEIISPFIREHLKAKITAARWMLALAMAMTLLLKGQWALWIVFIIIYNCEVKKLKEEALEADMKRGKKK